MTLFDTEHIEYGTIDIKYERYVVLLCAAVDTFIHLACNLIGDSARLEKCAKHTLTFTHMARSEQERVNESIMQ